MAAHAAAPWPGANDDRERQSRFNNSRSPTQPRSQCRGFSLFIPLCSAGSKFLWRAYTDAIRARSNSYMPRLIFAGEESTHARYGVVDWICVCLFGDRPRPIDQSVVTVACLGFEEQSVRMWNSWNKPKRRYGNRPLSMRGRLFPRGWQQHSAAGSPIYYRKPLMTSRGTPTSQPNAIQAGKHVTNE